MVLSARTWKGSLLKAFAGTSFLFGESFIFGDCGLSAARINFCDERHMCKLD